MSEKIVEVNVIRKKIDLSTDIFTDIKNIFGDKQALIFIRESHRVDFAFYNGDYVDWIGQEELKKEHLLEMRVFNNEKELLILKKGQALMARLIEDVDIEDNASEVFYKKTDECFMWGSEIKEEESCYMLKEIKGTVYHLPKIFDLPKGINIKYQLNNYMKSDADDGRLYNVDYRLVDILSINIKQDGEDITEEKSTEKYILKGEK